MSNSPITLTVNILDRDYQVSCPPSEQQALIQSARYLDEKMREIRSKGSVVGTDRIAVMAALNTSYELLDSSERLKEIDQGAESLLDKLDKALLKYQN
ncbi:MAG: cell division protein ZapA [Pseudomonadales bacterium]|nr:cell division protein ZapA [Pseudomonadales bacterium]